jgi:hypothetical protein
MTATPKKVMTTEDIRAMQKADAEAQHAAIKANLPAPVPSKSTAVTLLGDLDDVNRTLDEIAPTAMAGAMVKSTKQGTFEVTSTGATLNDLTDFRARCAETLYGYTRFNGEGNPPDRAMGQLYAGFKVKRDELGDDDEASWEISQFTGKPRDPWIFQFWVVLENVATNELYTFVTGSVTGTRAVNNLLRHFNRMQETKPGADPIVRLVKSSYHHKTFGDVAIPMFHITGRTAGGEVVPPKSLAEEMNDEVGI